jgi:hypothetical protein
MISCSNLNISTANFKSNLTPADKTAKTNLANEQMQASKSKEDVKRQIQIYQSRPSEELLKEVIKIDKSEEGWITKAINQIDEILSKKYTPGQIKTLQAKEPETMEEGCRRYAGKIFLVISSKFGKRQADDSWQIDWVWNKRGAGGAKSF